MHLCVYIFFNIRLSNEDMWKLHKGLQDLEIMVHMEYQTAIYFVSLHFLALLFCQLPIYCFLSWHPHNGKFARCTLLKCYNACCTLLGGQFNIHKLSNSQLHLAKFTTSHSQITIFTSPLLHCKLDKFTLFYGLPKFSGLPPPGRHPIHWSPKCFLPKLFFLGCFISGWVGGLF